MSNIGIRPDLDTVRAHFPALATDTVFLENAGGSQVPRSVADAIHRYMLESYVQLGADYALSQRATGVVADAHAIVKTLLHADGVGEVALGHSSSWLCRMLADCYADKLQPGDEIVVMEAGHEANISPWLRLEAKGIKIRWWRVDPKTGSSPLEGLDALLNERTRIVAAVHVSNLLGEVLDLAEVVRRSHAVGARVVADGVAYAPHRAIDVAGWGVDWYVYSTYKVYGPHLAALFGRHDAFAELEGPNHFFVPRTEIPYKFELGGASHEACAGLLALPDYLCFLAGGQAWSYAAVQAAFAHMEDLERPLQERLITWLDDHPRTRIVGPAHAGPERVATVSFTHTQRSSREVSLAAEHRGVGIRHGHMYAHRLCTALGIEPNDGVVRISCAHYNSPAEIEHLVAILDPVL
jgi:cysteine desulfurase family protein (TIGR01976 family)